MSEQDIAFVAVAVVALLYFLAGIRTVPIGAQAVVITGGRRTNQVRSEGVTWVAAGLQRLITLFVRERQVDVPSATYFTGDRVRISFKTTLRVSVGNVVALANQGEGTYRPFGQEGATEEANSALRDLVQNTIRTTVQTLTIDDVVFGGAAAGALNAQILQGLRKTCARWGLDVQEVFLTDVDTDSAAMGQAAESERLEQFRGRGRIAEQESQVARGAVFMQMALQIGAQIQRQTGHAVHPDEIQRFLMQRYDTERTLQIAMSASGHDSPLSLFYQARFGGMAHGGALPQTAPVPMGNVSGHQLQGGFAGQPALPGPGSLPTGSWIVGREGQFRVSGDGVSRQHVQFSSTGGRITVMDMGSSNGTYLRGQRLKPNVPVTISPDEPVQLGQSVKISLAGLLRRG